MATKIEWATETWNPITGCTKISAGCKNCYAERMAKRLAGRFGYPADEPFRVTFHEDRIGQPFWWKKPRMVFVCSMGDLFHEDVSFYDVERIFDVINQLDPTRDGGIDHKFLILTKRPERMKAFFEMSDNDWRITLNHNIWLGITAENQEQADKRIPVLLQIPAAVRFVSVEPMLEPVDLTRVGGNVAFDSLRAFVSKPSLHWVICGGESGHGARPMHPDWARVLRDQCQAAGVPFFMKQMSGKTKVERMAIPDDLMIREYPQKR